MSLCVCIFPFWCHHRRRHFCSACICCPPPSPGGNGHACWAGERNGPEVSEPMPVAWHEMASGLPTAFPGGGASSSQLSPTLAICLEAITTASSSTSNGIIQFCPAIILWLSSTSAAVCWHALVRRPVAVPSAAALRTMSRVLGLAPFLPHIPFHHFLFPPFPCPTHLGHFWPLHFTKAPPTLREGPEGGGQLDESLVSAFPPPVSVGIGNFVQNIYAFLKHHNTYLFNEEISPFFSFVKISFALFHFFSGANALKLCPILKELKKTMLNFE